MRIRLDPGQGFFGWLTGSAEIIERLGFCIAEIVSYFGRFPVRGVWLVEIQQNVAVQQIVGGKMQQRGNCSLELPYATNGSVVCRIRHECIYQLFDPFSRWLRSERTVRHGKR